MVRIRDKRENTGFTTVELIVTMLIISIIGGTSAASLVYVVQLFIYFPAEMNVRRVAEDIEDMIIEGDMDTKGLRYANSIVDATANRVTYSYGYPETVKYVRYDYSSNRMTISVSTDGTTWSTAKDIPSYLTSDISVQGKDSPSTLFYYYKANSATAFAPTPGELKDIRRVDINITVSTSSASISGREASFTASSGTDIKQYN